MSAKLNAHMVSPWVPTHSKICCVDDEFSVPIPFKVNVLQHWTYTFLCRNRYLKMAHSAKMKLALALLCMAVCLQVAHGGWGRGHITYYGSSNGGGTMGMCPHH